MTEDAATEDANIVSEGTVDTTDLLRRFADELDFRRGSDSDETQRARFLAELAKGGHLSDTGKAHAATSLEGITDSLDMVAPEGFVFRTSVNDIRRFGFFPDDGRDVDQPHHEALPATPGEGAATPRATTFEALDEALRRFASERFTPDGSWSAHDFAMDSADAAVESTGNTPSEFLDHLRSDPDAQDLLDHTVREMQDDREFFTGAGSFQALTSRIAYMAAELRLHQHALPAWERLQAAQADAGQSLDD